MVGFRTMNPKNAELISHYSYLEKGDLDRALAASTQAFGRWQLHPVEERARHIAQLGELFLAAKDRLAALASDEMGKPIAQALAEVEKCAAACRYYGEHAAGFLDDEPIATEHRKSYVAYRPIGAVLGVMPWNFPYWQVVRFAVPAICAGNTALLKHADSTAGCALALEELFAEAGLPEHTFRTLLISHDQTEQVIAHPHVRAVSLTGSERAGAQVAALAGKHLKKTVLELGGSDPYIILSDADVEQAAEVCAASRFINSGQSCVAAKRFIIDAAVYERFVDAFVAKAKARVMGDPRDPATDLGPLARADIAAGVDDQVQKSLAAGAKQVLGGKRPSGPGYFYPATVLGQVEPGMPAFDQEVFGPVAAMIKAKDEKQALALANQSIYGLGGAIFSRDVERAERLARTQLEVGVAVVNGMVVSDPRLPFGGSKSSGYGRELAHQGLREFVNVKTVVVS